MLCNHPHARLGPTTGLCTCDEQTRARKTSAYRGSLSVRVRYTKLKITMYSWSSDKWQNEAPATTHAPPCSQRLAACARLEHPPHRSLSLLGDNKLLEVVCLAAVASMGQYQFQAHSYFCRIFLRASPNKGVHALCRTQYPSINLTHALHASAKKSLRDPAASASWRL